MGTPAAQGPAAQKPAARKPTAKKPTATRSAPAESATVQSPGPGQIEQRPRRTVTRSGTARERAARSAPAQPATSPAAAAAAAALGGRADRLSAGHSAVGALLAAQVGEFVAPEPEPREAQPAQPQEQTGGSEPVDAADRSQPAAPTPTRRRAGTERSALASASTVASPPATTLVARPTLPPMDDVALGALVVIAERSWRIGARAVALATEASMRAVDVVRALSPQIANQKADERLAALAQRGRSVRTERTEALGTAFSEAITQAAASEAMRQMTVTAMQEAAEEVLAVVLPTMLDAVADLETQERLDELMAGLLLRQLPSALEKTLPGVMMRTATRPAAGLLPFLNGVRPR